MIFSDSAVKIQERHKTISPVIGAFKQEDEAFILMTWLTWVLPLLLVTVSLVDFGLILTYMKWLHPWRGIISEEVGENLF